jgi:hypothetical protein
MGKYLSQFQFIKATEKYSLYYDERKDEFIIYNGFSVFHFKLDDLGDNIFRGAYQPNN